MYEGEEDQLTIHSDDNRSDGDHDGDDGPVDWAGQLLHCLRLSVSGKMFRCEGAVLRMCRDCPLAFLYHQLCEGLVLSHLFIFLDFGGILIIAKIGLYVLLLVR